MLLLLLLLIPFLTGVVSFGLKGRNAYSWMLFSAVATMVVVIVAYMAPGGPDTFSMPWMPMLGATFTLRADGMALMLCLLNALIYLIIILLSWKHQLERPHSFWGLMLLTQAGMMGVFLASDALLFYFAWELALIPAYWLCSQWGGDRRIQVTYKFFVYTFAGSLLLLAGLLYVYLHTQSRSFAWEEMVAAGRAMPHDVQLWLFWLIFAAFAIKMPLFPFHTWQPDTYEVTATPVTIVLSAVMVKMGVYAVLRWLLPVVPDGAAYWGELVMWLSVIGIIYASLLAMAQTDIKRLVAYSSIAHMGLMSAAAFSGTPEGLNAVMVQMFNHGVIVAGMWLMVYLIESRYGTRDMRLMGGMATAMPWMSVGLVIIAFANISLPLTSGFVGEFMLFYALFQGGSDYHIWYMVLAGTGIIFGAYYVLSMVRRVAFGNLPQTEATIAYRDVNNTEWLALALILAFILFLGFYPQPLLNLVAAGLPV